MPRWRVDYLAGKDKHLGTVEAPDEKSAIAEAMKTFNITPARRFKLVVTKTEARDKQSRVIPSYHQTNMPQRRWMPSRYDAFIAFSVAFLSAPQRR
jgi:hypothetical protein